MGQPYKHFVGVECKASTLKFVECNKVAYTCDRSWKWVEFDIGLLVAVR